MVADILAFCLVLVPLALVEKNIESITGKLPFSHFHLYQEEIPFGKISVTNVKVLMIVLPLKTVIFFSLVKTFIAHKNLVCSCCADKFSFLQILVHLQKYCAEFQLDLQYFYEVGEVADRDRCQVVCL